MKKDSSLSAPAVGKKAAAEMKWYVLKAVSGKEGKVKEYIDLGIKNGHFGENVSQVLIPTEKVVYTTPTGKRTVKERNSMPGYVLVEARLVGEIAQDLRYTPNVLGFLGGMDHPESLRQSEVNRILGSIDEMETEGQEVLPEYQVGDSIKVIEGPFNNFSGVVKEINVEKKKLTVAVKVFGRETPLELGYMQVTKE